MKHPPGRLLAALSVGLVGIATPATAQTVTATVPTGAQPGAVEVNPVTNRIYVVNQNGASVTVIDGTTNATTTVAVGAGPRALAVNPVTYVANQSSNDVTVIDGASNATTTVPTATGPFAIAANPVTNRGQPRFRENSSLTRNPRDYPAESRGPAPHDSSSWSTAPGATFGPFQRRVRSNVFCFSRPTSPSIPGAALRSIC